MVENWNVWFTKLKVTCISCNYPFIFSNNIFTFTITNKLYRVLNADYFILKIFKLNFNKNKDLKIALFKKIKSFYIERKTVELTIWMSIIRPNEYKSYIFTVEINVFVVIYYKLLCNTYLYMFNYYYYKACVNVSFIFKISL